MEMLAEVARRSDRAVAEARAELVREVRRAANLGMTQVEIAREIGRSQPEVSRLLRFHPLSHRGRRLRQLAPDIRRIVGAAGGTNVRVFGSVATGEDQADSDVDLLFTMREPIGLLALSALEDALADLIGTEVDLVPDSSLRPDVRDRVLAEAVRL
ncbi:MAG: nucleotidyltransferase domain-containing protein [bacterium]|nr:nucleotidyltransferase domain-containing protein [bacterium]